MEPGKATSLRRAVELLLALASDDALAAGGLGVKRLTALLDDEKSQVSRSLNTLREYGLVERDPDTLAFRIGWRVYALAQRAGDARLLAAAPPVAAELVGQFQESAHLSVLQGAQVLTVVSHPSPRAITAVSWVGRHIPAHCTSSGRALLFDHDRAALERELGPGPLPPAGPRAPRTVADLARRIAAARAAGYATVVEESEPGLVAAAAPVRDHRGRIVAALNLSGPAFRFQPRLNEAGERLVQAAGVLSAAIGGPPGTDAGARRAERPGAAARLAAS